MTPARPLWLWSPGVQELLGLLVDRLDAAELRGTQVQSVPLNEKTWPALYKAPLESRKEALWEHVGEMCRWGWFRVKPAGAEQARSGYDRGPRLSIADEAALREVTGRPERQRSAIERWREAVDAELTAPEAVKRAVGDYCIDLPDRSMAEVVQKLNQLQSLADQPLLLREVSSRLFWGMSKVLDKRQGLVATVLGLDECPFPESPIQLQVHLPPGGYQAVLFIENLMSFEQALRSTSGVFGGLALVYASGFKGSAQRLRSRSGCSLFYSQRGALEVEARAAFERWLFDREDLPGHFWGDLDYSGMRILAALRASFPGLTAWAPGYAPMVATLQEGGGHSPESADKQGQHMLSATGCDYADGNLLPALKLFGRFVDQELLVL